MAHENVTADRDRRQVPTDQPPSPIGTESAATATIAATRSAASADGRNTLTIIGQGTPSSFELTVDGEIELADESATADVTVLSGTTVEGTVESETVAFRFSGDLTDVTFVDRGITGLEPATTPNVHVDYGAPDRT
ncbi:hypothetical protein [Natrinema sp. 1APR25-10V2]|uniref:hypothetical protein n=1 Tax=Natrinema sp. 1APR25-10V2 TaxID=2951081 RepID=UPI002876C48A|nr:hypothetical protein [Natrinema sp. 1APR25-10V2]MDS0478556.1 hypothetical protein [Natrinema sp. 1APR25-10V2]